MFQIEHLFQLDISKKIFLQNIELCVKAGDIRVFGGVPGDRSIGLPGGLVGFMPQVMIIMMIVRMMIMTPRTSASTSSSPSRRPSHTSADSRDSPETSSTRR